MIMPYLQFKGTCKEAFTWYANIFEGEVQHLAKFGDLPEEISGAMAPEQKAKVMHGQVMLTQTGGLSGADVLEGETQGAMVQAHLLGVNMAQKVFEALAQGGQVIANLAENPPPDNDSLSGCVRDKYGITWILSAMKG